MIAPSTSSLRVKGSHRPGGAAVVVVAGAEVQGQPAAALDEVDEGVVLLLPLVARAAVVQGALLEVQAPQPLHPVAVVQLVLGALTTVDAHARLRHVAAVAVAHGGQPTGDWFSQMTADMMLRMHE